MTTAVRWLSAITAVIVLVQAILIGQVIGLGEVAQQALHGTLGSGTLLAALILTGLAFVAMRRGELSGFVLGLSVVATILIVAQLGLGYVGRRNGVAAAIHVPNGVLIAGLLFALLTTTLSPATSTGQSRT